MSANIHSKLRLSIFFYRLCGVANIDHGSPLSLCPPCCWSNGGERLPYVKIPSFLHFKFVVDRVKCWPGSPKCKYTLAYFVGIFPTHGIGKCKSPWCLFFCFRVPSVVFKPINSSGLYFRGAPSQDLSLPHYPWVLSTFCHAQLHTCCRKPCGHIYFPLSSP